MSGLRFGLGLTMQGRGGKAWRDYDLFETGSGFLYDFSRADTLFQEATGITPAGVDQNVGLALDISKWGGKTLAQVLAGQPELAPSSGSTLTGWAVADSGGGNTSSNGTSIRIQFPGGGSGFAGCSFAAGMGKTLHVIATIVVASGTLTLQIGSDVRNYGAGTYTFSRTIGRTPSVDTVSFKRFNASTAVDATISDISVKKIPGNHASQATSGARPVLKAGGLTRYDGSDDNLLLNYLSQPVMTLMTKCGPAVPGAIRLLLGACDAASANRIQLQSNSAGNLSARVGSSGQVDTSFPMNAVSTVGLVIDGSNLGIIANGVVISTTSYSGAPTSTTPLRIGAFNNNGAAGNFWNGDIYHALAVNRALTPAEVVKLTNAWSAA